MAMDMFFDISGIPGESQDKEFKDKIDVLAWSWGMSQSGTFHAGSGGGAGKADVQDISFTKYLDSASPKLMLHVLTGKHIPDATLIMRKAGEKPQTFLKLTFTDLMITSSSTGGSGGEDRLVENLGLNFAKVKLEYFKQDAKGVAAAAGDFTYDVQKNTTA